MILTLEYGKFHHIADESGFEIRPVHRDGVWHMNFYLGTSGNYNQMRDIGSVQTDLWVNDHMVNLTAEQRTAAQVGNSTNFEKWERAFSNVIMGEIETRNTLDFVRHSDAPRHGRISTALMNQIKREFGT